MHFKKSKISRSKYEIRLFKPEHFINVLTIESLPSGVKYNSIINECLKVVNKKGLDRTISIYNELYTLLPVPEKIRINEFCFIKVKSRSGKPGMSDKEVLAAVAKHGFKRVDWLCLLGLLKHKEILLNEFKDAGLVSFSGFNTHTETVHDYQAVSDPYTQPAPSWTNTITDYPVLGISDEKGVEMGLVQSVNYYDRWLVTFK